MSTPQPAIKPTRTRHWVVVLAVTLAVITYIDRVCISQAAPFIMRDLNFTKVQMGYGFSAFALAYALFEIPGGWMGDWLGPRKVLLRVVTWWSFFTAAMGWIWSLPSLIITNFLFGAGEAGCFPNLTKIFTTWLPQAERIRAQGFMWMSARWGGAFTPMIVIWMLQFVSWRNAFQIFGLIGVVWAVIFYRWFRDNPREHPGVNKAELALLEGADKMACGHGNVPWRKLVSTPTVWLLWLQYFCISYTFWFYITWLPTYLREARKLSAEYAASVAVFPLLFGGAGCLLAGFLGPWIAKRIGVRKGRRTMGYMGCLGAAALLMIHTGVSDAFWAMVIMGLASFSNDLVMPGAWGSCMDVGGKYAGTLSGSMNMMGNLGGATAPITLGYIVQNTGNWTLAFYIMAAAYVVAAVAWALLDPVTPLEAEKKPA